MIQTHLLTLQPPYNYIYYGGIVGKQIATLVVTVDNTDKEGNYGLETHSHPVVVYNGQTAEGVVWDKCEVMDCRTVCSEKERSITLQKFSELMALTSCPMTDNPGNPMYRFEPMNPYYLRSALRAAGIGLEMPTDDNYYGPDQFGTVKNYEVTIYFDVDDDGWGAYSQLNESPFYFNIETPHPDEIANLLIAQLEDWKRALEEFRLSFTFKGASPYGEEGYVEYDEKMVNEIIEKLNAHSAK